MGKPASGGMLICGTVDQMGLEGVVVEDMVRKVVVTMGIILGLAEEVAEEAVTGTVTGVPRTAAPHSLLQAIPTAQRMKRRQRMIMERTLPHTEPAKRLHRVSRRQNLHHRTHWAPTTTFPSLNGFQPH
jgi:hypothetical protein